MIVPPLMTADELLHDQPLHKSTELVCGRMIVREPPSSRHGRYAATLSALLWNHVHSQRLGAVFGQDTGFHIASDPDTVRAPDVAYVITTRLHLISATGYARMAPDMVAEILSPGDRAGEVLRKTGEWLEAGVQLVWVIDPVRGTARVHRSDGSDTDVPVGGELSGEDVLPGFRCALADVFE